MGKKNEVEQLDMGLKEPFGNRFKNFRYNLELFFAKLRTHSLFTAPFLWISLAIVCSLISVQIYYYLNFFENLPKEVPVFLIARDANLRLLEKDFLLWFIILSILFTLISLIVSVKVFYRFKFIAMFVMTNLTIAVSFLTIAFIKIFGIYIF